MDIERVRKALQRSTHMTDKQLAKNYKEFIVFYHEEKFRIALEKIKNAVIARKNEILYKD